MTGDVNTHAAADHTARPRRYDNRRRRTAATRTREAILAAARKQFVEAGYSATTMATIAREAGVAPDTIYASIGPKPALFRLLIEQVLSGQSTPVPAEQRAYVREIAAAPDARSKIARYARAVRELHAQLAPLFVVFREGARLEPELAAVWQDIAERRAANMRRFVAELGRTGELRPDLTVSEAADVVWATNDAAFYTLLVDERQWAPERFEYWLTELWARTLLQS